jgi:asparagine synthase (glutamine-hydrolysing)
MVHRGPDDDGFHCDGDLGLAMRRLSIIDIDGGAQPIFNERRDVCVLSNGEIYNFRELRRELEAHGHVFSTRSDTEVIVHAYEEWGTAAFGRLNGMFAVAVWNARERRLTLARDPFGVKPLYWWDNGSTLVFGSELRALFCHPLVPRAVDTSGLRQYLALTYVPSPRTAFQHVSKLPPGHLAVCDAGGVRVERYDSHCPEPSIETREALVDRLRYEIERAVERQMVADVPIGVMLSGGADSGTVATIMSGVAQRPIETFTVGFAGPFERNELDAARETAQRLGSVHHEVVISSDEFTAFLSDSIWHLEEPIATTSAFAFHAVCALARSHVKVVLTGQGADEPFAGYPRHLGERYGELYRRIPRALRAGLVAPLVAALPRNEQLKRAVASLATPDEIERLVRIYSVLDEDLQAELGLEEVPAADELGAAISRWHPKDTALDSLGKMLYVDARLSLPDNLLLYADKMSMAVSLEARVPFLDLELMRLAESIPTSFKIRKGQQKAILKEAMAAWLPDALLQRKKIGFDTPIDQWFRGEMRATVRERLLDHSSACRMYFRPDVIDRMIRDHESGRHDHKRVLYSLLTFEVWYEQFIRPVEWPQQGHSHAAAGSG